eukprot:3160563-Pyramimonas_sp.AAC.1
MLKPRASCQRVSLAKPEHARDAKARLARRPTPRVAGRKRDGGASEVADGQEKGSAARCERGARRARRRARSARVRARG